GQLKNTPNYFYAHPITQPHYSTPLLNPISYF
ncbi:MAG: hypothetical protein ACI945_001935, partial [Pseudohongiellaceae bacterium]